MGATELSLSVDWGNMFIWIWLEIFALGMLILWTMNLAHIIIARRIHNSQSVRVPYKRKFIDFLPMNGDIHQLPLVSKTMITLIRLLVTFLVAISTLGIDPGVVYKQSKPTTHVIVPIDSNFTGRSFHANNPDSVQDFAVSACEEVDVISVKKLRAFVSGSTFSCNSGKKVGHKDVIAEVIWDREGIRQISKAQKRPANIKLGDLSMLSKQRSNKTDIWLTNSDGAPVTMFLTRRYLVNATLGDRQGDREYLLFHNHPKGEIFGHYVAVALVICKPGSKVMLRNTDQMISLPDLGANQQMNLARRVAGSLVSIVPNKNERMYFGDTGKVTIISSGYNYFILALGLSNSLFFITTLLVRRHYETGLNINVFSSVSMYSLAESFWTGKERLNVLPEKGIQLSGKETEHGLEVFPDLYLSSESTLRLDLVGFLRRLVTKCC